MKRYQSKANPDTQMVKNARKTIRYEDDDIIAADILHNNIVCVCVYIGWRKKRSVLILRLLDGQTEKAVLYNINLTGKTNIKYT